MTDFTQMAAELYPAHIQHMQHLAREALARENLDGLVII